MLADIPNCHIFGNMVSAVNTKLSDIISRTPINTASMTMGGSANVATALGLSQLTPVTDIVRCNGSANYQVAAAGVLAFTPNTEPVVFYTSTANTNNSLTYQMELSAFKDTIMELNKIYIFMIICF